MFLDFDLSRLNARRRLLSFQLLHKFFSNKFEIPGLFDEIQFHALPVERIRPGSKSPREADSQGEFTRKRLRLLSNVARNYGIAFPEAIRKLWYIKKERSFSSFKGGTIAQGVPEHSLFRFKKQKLGRKKVEHSKLRDRVGGFSLGALLKNLQ